MGSGTFGDGFEDGDLVFPQKYEKKLTIFGILCTLMNTNTILGSNANTIEIVQGSGFPCAFPFVGNGNARSARRTQPHGSPCSGVLSR